MVAFTLAIHTVSETNRAGSEHWAITAKRAKRQKGQALLLTRSFAGRAPIPMLPWVVTLTRVAPKRLDEGNLAASMKHVQDGMCLALGVDDGDLRVLWRYRQTKGRPHEYAVSVTIEPQPTQADMDAAREKVREWSGCVVTASGETARCDTAVRQEVKSA